MAERKRCWWCNKPLPTETIMVSCSSHPLYACTCGIQYSPELVETTDGDVWQAVADRDGYMVTRHGDTLTVTADQSATAKRRERPRDKQRREHHDK